MSLSVTTVPGGPTPKHECRHNANAHKKVNLFKRAVGRANGFVFGNDGSREFSTAPGSSCCLVVTICRGYCSAAVVNTMTKATYRRKSLLGLRVRGHHGGSTVRHSQAWGWRSFRNGQARCWAQSGSQLEPQAGDRVLNHASVRAQNFMYHKHCSS